MAKNISAPLARTARLLDLVPYLNTHQGISLQELARKFDVTTAQITSDLTTLWMCGLPGYTPLELMDLDFESGYVTIHNASTLSKPRTITFEEGVALLLGLDLVRSSLPEDRQDLITTVDGLAAVLFEKIGMSPSITVIPDVNSATRAAIELAINNSTGLEIDYHSLYSDTNSTRTITPLEFFEEAGREYLRAFCYSSNDLRTFRIDRILEARAQRIEKTQTKDSTFSDKIAFTIAVISANRDLMERFAISDLHNLSEITLSSFSQQWIERSIFASAGTAELIEPSVIRSEIAAKAQVILDRYKPR